MRWSGIILVVVGALLLARNFDLMTFGWLRQWWPALLIACGVMILLRPRRGRHSSRVDRDNDPSRRSADDRP